MCVQVSYKFGDDATVGHPPERPSQSTRSVSFEGLMNGLFAPVLVRAIYADELHRLEHHAQGHGAISLRRW
jgi:hypothetical protein